MRRTLWIIGLLGGVLSCSSLPRPASDHPVILQRITSGSYDIAWNAALRTLDERHYTYPTAKKEAGYIETEFMEGESSSEFYYAGGQKRPKESRWKIRLWLLALPSSGESTQTRIKIEKEYYLRSGSLETWQPTPADTLEEEIILYRMGRLLDLNKMIEGLTTKP